MWPEGSLPRYKSPPPVTVLCQMSADRFPLLYSGWCVCSLPTCYLCSEALSLASSAVVVCFCSSRGRRNCDPSLDICASCDTIAEGRSRLGLYMVSTGRWGRSWCLRLYCSWTDWFTSWIFCGVSKRLYFQSLFFIADLSRCCYGM